MTVPSINEVRNLGQRHDLYGVLVLSITKTGHYAVTTWGHTKNECGHMKNVNEQLADLIESEEITLPCPM